METNTSTLSSSSLSTALSETVSVSWKVLLTQLRQLFLVSRSSTEWLRKKTSPSLIRAAQWARSNRILLALTLSVGSYSLLHWHYHHDPQDDARWRRIEAEHDTEHCPTQAPRDAPFVSRFEYVTTPAGDIVQTCVFYPNSRYFGLTDFGRPSKFGKNSRRGHRTPTVIGSGQGYRQTSYQNSTIVEEEEDSDSMVLPSELLADSLTAADGSDPSMFDSVRDSQSEISQTIYNTKSEPESTMPTWKKDRHTSSAAVSSSVGGPGVSYLPSGMSRSRSVEYISETRSLGSGSVPVRSKFVGGGIGDLRDMRSHNEQNVIPIVRGIIYFCHGYGSNIMGDVYWHLAQLASTMEGYAIISVEYPNHGRSDGLYVYIPSWNKMIDSVESVFNDLRNKYWPKHIRERYSIPTFLFGQSMGGAVALYLARRIEQRRAEKARRKRTMFPPTSIKSADGSIRPTVLTDISTDTVDDLPLSVVSSATTKIVGSSGSKLIEQRDEKTKKQQKRMSLDSNDTGLMSVPNFEDDIDALRGVILQAPMCHISEKQRLHPIIETALKTLAFFLPTFPITPDANGEDDDEAGGTWSYWATHNSEVQRWLAESPLYYNRPIRLGTALNLLKVTENISENIKVLIGNPNISVLIQHGSLDRITSPQHSKYFFKSCVSNDKTLIIYQNQFHKLMIEPEFRRIVFDDIERWLYQRTGAAQGRLATSKRRRCNRYIFKKSIHD